MTRLLFFVVLAVVCVARGDVTSQSTPAPAPAPTPAPAVSARALDSGAEEATEEPPEGYYAFVESPNATPPSVRAPPYAPRDVECAEARELRPRVSADNLCGDLNRGLIPRNPMGQNPNGEPYPFALLRNHTLRFLSRALPVLRADDTLPRVTHVPHAPPPPAPHQQYSLPADNYDYPYDQLLNNRLEDRIKRSASEALQQQQLPAHALPREHRALDAPEAVEAGGAGGDAPREGRKFCDGGGVFCMLYRAINGDGGGSGGAGATGGGAGVERREDPGPHAPQGPHAPPRYEGPPTPCPARVEYATPVFARNYQGVWRYVVQIPYEGYFTQTVEVTRCMQSRCHYLDGGCLSSPRWVSLLVAELHYPPPPPQTAPPTQPARNDYQEYQQYGQSKPSAPSDSGEPADKPQHCDGHDEMGCFQVRLYYDWFLVPGSCKCWRPDYFARYVRRRHSEL